jgi:hypothetical protein
MLAERFTIDPNYWPKVLEAPSVFCWVIGWGLMVMGYGVGVLIKNGLLVFH